MCKIVMSIIIRMCNNTAKCPEEHNFFQRVRNPKLVGTLLSQTKCQLSDCGQFYNLEQTRCFDVDVVKAAQFWAPSHSSYAPASKLEIRPFSKAISSAIYKGASN